MFLKTHNVDSVITEHPPTPEQSPVPASDFRIPLRERRQPATVALVKNNGQPAELHVQRRRATGIRCGFAAAAMALIFLLVPHPATAASQVTLCTPYEVVVYAHSPSTGASNPQRLHVQCTAPVGNISYFAVPGSDPAEAARVLSIITTALVSGRTLNIQYDPADLSGASIGCQNSNCRLIQSIGFQK